MCITRVRKKVTWLILFRFPDCTEIIVNAIQCRGGTGLKNQVLFGYWVIKKIQVRDESGSGPRKTLPENTCITSEVIYRHKGLEYVSTTTPNFPWPQHFLAF